MMGMPPVTAPIGPAHIGDHRLGIPALGLERGDQRVLGFDGQRVCALTEPETDGVFGNHPTLPFGARTQAYPRV